MTANKQDIKDAYIQYVLQNGQPPKRAYQFAQVLGHDEKEFYKIYPNLNAIEKDIWADYFALTQMTLNKDEVYQTYNTREKLLAFHYTLIEVLKDNRDFIQHTIGSKNAIALQGTPSVLQDFKAYFVNFAGELLQEGVETQEVEARPLVSNYYGEMLWYKTLAVLFYWMKDESEDYAKTDVLIEKSVHLAFDLMGKTVLDSVYDLAKFLITNR